MIKFRHKPKLLYLHGKDEEIKYPKGGPIYQTLRKHFDIDFAPLSSDPTKGWEDFKNIDFSAYTLVVGFSMGAVYASSQNQIPMILINPGYGLSKMWPEFKRIDEASMKVKGELVRKILVGSSDKYSSAYLPEIQKRKLEDKIVYIPGKHVPEESEIEKYIIPEINDQV